MTSAHILQELFNTTQLHCLPASITCILNPDVALDLSNVCYHILKCSKNPITIHYSATEAFKQQKGDY